MNRKEALKALEIFGARNGYEHVINDENIRKKVEKERKEKEKKEREREEERKRKEKERGKAKESSQWTTILQKADQRVRQDRCNKKRDAQRAAGITKKSVFSGRGLPPSPKRKMKKRNEVMEYDERDDFFVSRYKNGEILESSHELQDFVDAFMKSEDEDDVMVDEGTSSQTMNDPVKLLPSLHEVMETSIGEEVDGTQLTPGELIEDPTMRPTRRTKTAAASKLRRWCNSFVTRSPVGVIRRRMMPPATKPIASSNRQQRRTRNVLQFDDDEEKEEDETMNRTMEEEQMEKKKKRSATTEGLKIKKERRRKDEEEKEQEKDLIDGGMISEEDNNADLGEDSLTTVKDRDNFESTQMSLPSMGNTQEVTMKDALDNLMRTMTRAKKAKHDDEEKEGGEDMVEEKNEGNYDYEDEVEDTNPHMSSSPFTAHFDFSQSGSVRKRRSIVMSEERINSNERGRGETRKRGLSLTTKGQSNDESRRMEEERKKNRVDGDTPVTSHGRSLTARSPIGHLHTVEAMEANGSARLETPPRGMKRKEERGEENKERVKKEKNEEKKEGEREENVNEGETMYPTREVTPELFDDDEEEKKEEERDESDGIAGEGREGKEEEEAEEEWETSIHSHFPFESYNDHKEELKCLSEAFTQRLRDKQIFQEMGERDMERIRFVYQQIPTGAEIFGLIEEKRTL